MSSILSKSSMILYAMIFLIGLIGVMDNVMNVVFMEELESNEQNPFALMIIKRWGVENFVIAKSAGIVTVVGILFFMIRSKWRWFVVTSVLTFQIWLFCYLSYYSPEDGFSLDYRLEITENIVINSTINFYKDYFKIGG